jgi:CXXX repeat peptide maturase
MNIIKIFEQYSVKKVNIKMINYDKWGKEELIIYEELLNNLSDYIYKNWLIGNYIQIDIITNNLLLDEKAYCMAGVTNFTVSPTGEIYPCSAYYYNKQRLLGSVENQQLNVSETMPQLIMCNHCSSEFCNKCSYLNEQSTLERLVPFESHCVKANLEARVSYRLKSKIIENDMHLPFDINTRLLDVEHLDPLIKLRAGAFSNRGLNDL